MHRLSDETWLETTSGPTIYLYDGPNLLEELDSSGNVLARYTGNSEKADEPLSELRSGTTSYYEQDGLGSVSSLSNSAGSLANTYSYDSFGKLTASTEASLPIHSRTPWEFDSETGIYYYRARYDDQTTGRFLSEDPSQGTIDGSANLYVYAFNNAVNYVVPSGLYILKPGIPAPSGADTTSISGVVILRAALTVGRDSRRNC